MIVVKAYWKSETTSTSGTREHSSRYHGISNLKLQKILYLIQAYSLIQTKRPCFSEDIEAWDFGPVIPDVYRKYKQFGSTDIQVRCRSLEEIQKGFEKEDRKRIEEVVDPKLAVACL